MLLLYHWWDLIIVNLASSLGSVIVMSSPAINTNAPKPPPVQLRASVEREIGPSLADIAAMEELKRRLASGGGGGAPPMKSPTQFVLYSMSIINQKMMEMYRAVIAAFERNQANQTPQAVQAEATTVFKEITLNVREGMRIVGEFFRFDPKQQLLDITKQARAMVSDATKFMTVSLFAMASKFMKLLGFNRSDDESFEAEDLYKKQTMHDTEDLMPSLSQRLFDDGKSDQTAISHIQNISDQANRVIAAQHRDRK